MTSKPFGTCLENKYLPPFSSFFVINILMHKKLSHKCSYSNRGEDNLADDFVYIKCEKIIFPFRKLIKLWHLTNNV